MIVLSQILGLFSVSLNVLDSLIVQYVSEDVAEMLLDFIRYAPTGTMNVFFIVISLWSASKVQHSLMRITNYTMTEGQSGGRGFFRDRLKAVRTAVFTLFTVAFALIILIYGEPIFKLVLNTAYRALEIQYTVDKTILLMRWPVAFIMYFMMVTYNYYVLPYEKVTLREVLPGSVFSTVVMIIATVVYSEYTKYAVKFDILYGSLASAVALMFWFYFLSWALGLGVLFNKAWVDTKGDSSRG
jgi:membrane protein